MVLRECLVHAGLAVVTSGEQDYRGGRVGRRMGHGSTVSGVGKMLVPPTDLSAGGGAGLTTRQVWLLILFCHCHGRRFTAHNGTESNGKHLHGSLQSAEVNLKCQESKWQTQGHCHLHKRVS